MVGNEKGLGEGERGPVMIWNGMGWDGMDWHGMVGWYRWTGWLKGGMLDLDWDWDEVAILMTTESMMSCMTSCMVI